MHRLRGVLRLRRTLSVGSTTESCSAPIRQVATAWKALPLSHECAITSSVLHARAGKFLLGDEIGQGMLRGDFADDLQATAL